jgi:hypothetical protein
MFPCLKKNRIVLPGLSLETFGEISLVSTENLKLKITNKISQKCEPRDKLDTFG